MLTEIPQTLHDLLAEQSVEIEDFLATFTAEKLTPILRDARQMVIAKIADLRKRGSPELTITMYKKLLAEIQNAAFASGAQLGQALDEGIDIADKMGFTNFVAQLSVAAAASGLNDAGELVDLLKIQGSSRLRQINEARKLLTADETALYTAEQIATAERTLTTVFMAGGSFDDAADALISNADGTPWAAAEWKGERLARTELMRAMNSTAIGAIDEGAKTIPLGKQWYEYAVGPNWGEGIGIPYPGPATPLDKRVGQDSKRMHAQVVVGDQMWIDPGRGMQYADAPSRPNGREVIIPFILT